MAGLLWDSADFQRLSDLHMGDYGTLPEGSPNPPGYEEFEASLRDLQVERSEAFAAILRKAGFDIAIPVRNWGPAFECVESLATMQCGDGAAPGEFMVVVVSAPLKGAPDVLGNIELRHGAAGSQQRVLPLSTFTAFSEFRRAMLDDPALREKSEILESVITPEVAAELRLPAGGLSLNVSVLPDRGS